MYEAEEKCLTKEGLTRKIEIILNTLQTIEATLESSIDKIEGSVCKEVAGQPDYGSGTLHLADEAVNGANRCMGLAYKIRELL